MDTSPVTDGEAKAIALEEGWNSCLRLDKLRLQMLNEAVMWICDLTGLPVNVVRSEIALKKVGQVSRNLATIKAVTSVLQAESAPKQ